MYVWIYLGAQAEARDGCRPEGEHDHQRHAGSAAEDAVIKDFDNQATYVLCISHIRRVYVNQTNQHINTIC